MTRQAAAVCLIAMSFTLAGCGSISSFMAGGMADLIPAWAGGLPADAPPRPGTPEYEAYLRAHMSPQGAEATRGPDAATSTSADAIH